MKISRQRLKKLVIQEIDATKFRRRVRTGVEQAEKEFFGEPLEGTPPPQAPQGSGDELLDSAAEKELLGLSWKTDRATNIAYRAIFVEKDPVALAAYNRFKKAGKNVFGNEEKFLDAYWMGPESRARAAEQFKQAKATSASRAPGQIDQQGTVAGMGGARGRAGDPAVQAAVKDSYKKMRAQMGPPGRKKLQPTRVVSPVKRKLKEQTTPSQIQQAAGQSEEEEEQKRVDAMNTGDSAAASSQEVTVQAQKQVASGEAPSGGDVWTSGGAVSAEEPAARKEDDDDDKISEKISYLMKNENMPRKQAVAVALSMKERGELEERIMKITKTELMSIIKEELEVVLTNEEIEEFFDVDPEALLDELEEDKDWIQKAVDPEHKGYCTPMTKKTCTPARKALAKRFKKAGRKEKEEGGTGWQGKV